ncbi:MAG: nucleotidyl transferase AbiEii/AbiGii toxin family protein [Ferruginibacter sp.]
MPEPIDILNPVIAEMLKTMENIFREFEVDFFLVGALARDIRLSAHESFAAKRRTNDVDIAILLDAEEKFYAIKEALVNTGHFVESSYKAIKLIYKDSIELDLLPFGEIENEERELLLSRHTLLVMDMSGFKEVYPFVETLTIAEGLSLNVCTMEGLVMLKLIANYDNPTRTKDITDIEHFLEVYFEMNSNEIYTAYMEVMDLYDTAIPNYLPLVSARVVGRKMKAMLEGVADTTEYLKTILTKRPVATWQAMLDGIND